ncbi:hypothetical protein BJY21_003368 [Kineosphaera limosa]|uniref:O-antigen ligase-related domain-containing protein n=1 Tax=Kineosphaera limosa NBRC 100340 TaxID=1184609 RepID=K6W4F2_9MICO|nr:O-antigen ligase family protein [Kineosphaera limosa]NYE02184.1 hypothetical protein [Kineosphaera limosa]GAB94035.1 hypothetical protein KILIM_001_00370 [Kineosphaera limosa NBRC 100340]
MPTPVDGAPGSSTVDKVAAPGTDASGEPDQDRFAAPHLALTLLLLVIGVVPWRAKAYFDGSGDPVVFAKAAVILAALCIALAPRDTAVQLRRHPVAAAPLLFAGLYLLITCLGAFTAGGIVATGVVAARVALVVATLTLLASRYGIERVAAWLYRVLLAVVVVSVVTGLPSLASGRLHGGLPPLHANEIALLAGLCLVWIWARFVRGEELARHYPSAAALLGILLLTGSRTGLIAVVLALVVMLTRLTRLSYSALGVGLAAIPIVTYLLLSTDAAESTLSRGGSEEVGTLSNRTIAWSAAIHGVNSWHSALLGSGLATKKIPVPGQWWNTQILDSSWVSALVQAGIFGFATVLIWFVVTLVAALWHRGPLATVWIGWMSLLAVRGVLESGLFDATTSFIAFFVASLGCWRFTRDAEGDPATVQPQIRP